MDTYPIRTATDESLRDFVRPLESAFAEPWSDPDFADFALTAEADRVIAAFDGERPVATAGAYTFRLTVPGGEVAAAGVTLVGVVPSHRRRGILRAMLAHQLEDIVARGEPVAILWASEGAIYQRFGYGLATLAGEFTLDTARAAFLRPLPTGGRVRLLEGDDAVAACAPVYDAVAARTPGMCRRSERWWRAMVADLESLRASRGPKYIATLDLGGAPAAYAIYRVKLDWDERGPNGMLTAQELVGLTPDAERAMWAWLFSADLVTRVRGVRQPIPPPLTFMLAEPRRLGTTVGDGLWLRLVDLPAALTARTYRAPGSLVLDVADDGRPSNAGRWRLTVAGGGPRPDDPTAGSRATVERTDAEPDLVLGVAELGATYLGGTRFESLRRAGRIEERRPGAVAEADALFASIRQPWCPTMF